MASPAVRKVVRRPVSSDAQRGSVVPVPKAEATISRVAPHPSAEQSQSAGGGPDQTKAPLHRMAGKRPAPTQPLVITSSHQSLNTN